MSARAIAAELNERNVPTPNGGPWSAVTEDCKAYLSECQALAEEAKLSLRRATAVIAVCHAWLALRDAIFTYETIAAEEDAAQAR